MERLQEQASKSNTNKNIDISVGDIVILKNDQTCRSFWKLVKIEQLLKGDDELVRAVIVKVLGGDNKVQLLRQLIQHLIPVERKAPAEKVNNLPDSSRKDQD